MPHLLQTIFGNYRRQIVVTYLVTLAENLFELSYPSLTGLAVNGLLKHDFTGLGLLLGVWFAHTVTGVFRQSYDTRVFSSIFTDLATRTVSEQETKVSRLRKSSPARRSPENLSTFSNAMSRPR